MLNQNSQKLTLFGFVLTLVFAIGTYQNASGLAQVNACGNGFGGSNVMCQNVITNHPHLKEFASQIQGNGNAVNVIGVQG